MKQLLHSITEMKYNHTIKFEASYHSLWELLINNVDNVEQPPRYSFVDVINDHISYGNIIGFQFSMLRDCAYKDNYLSTWRPSKYNEYYGRHSLRDLV